MLKFFFCPVNTNFDKLGTNNTYVFPKLHPTDVPLDLIIRQIHRQTSFFLSSHIILQESVEIMGEDFLLRSQHFYIMCIILKTPLYYSNLCTDVII